jgi:hypothetical protein
MLFFNFNMLFIGIFFSLIWTYVTRKEYFIEGMTLKKINQVKKINYFLPSVALIAIGITFISPELSPFSYFLIIFKRLTN